MNDRSRLDLSWTLTSLSRIADELQDLAMRENRVIAFAATRGTIIAPVGTGTMVEPGQRKAAIIRDLVAAIHGELA